MRKHTSEFVYPERTDPQNISVRIDSQGIIIVDDLTQFSESKFTDIVRIKKIEATKSDDINVNGRHVPNINDLVSLKHEIAELSGQERKLSGPLRIEFRRQITKIRNLYRLVHDEVMDPQIHQPNENARILILLLFKNWDKLKSVMKTAQSYC